MNLSSLKDVILINRGALKRFIFKSSRFSSSPKVIDILEAKKGEFPDEVQLSHTLTLADVIKPISSSNLNSSIIRNEETREILGVLTQSDVIKTIANSAPNFASSFDLPVTEAMIPAEK